MHYFKVIFDSLEEAKKEFAEAKAMYDFMVGTLYKEIVAVNIIFIKREIQRLEKQKFRETKV
jgi:hypothetical protein